MKLTALFQSVIWLVFMLAALPALAFPPAPHHILYGMVRDEYGTPLNLASAEVVFVTAAGEQVRATSVAFQSEPGVNYQLKMPLDSGVTSARYKPTATAPNLPFRLQVRIGQTLYLPIEMAGHLAQMGQPAKRTRLDLTLGVDADDDGLPDAWQQLLRALLGPNALIGPNDDADGDGSSNYSEYIAGTYAFDPADRLKLTLLRGVGQGETSSLTDVAGILPQRFYRIILVETPPQSVPASLQLSNGLPKVSWSALGGRTYRVQYKNNLLDANWTDLSSDVASGGAVLQFPAVSGRTYSLQGTTNMVHWVPLKFRIPAGSPAAPAISDYFATTSQSTEAEVLFEASVPPALFFRVQVR